jgi:hypothetical protein
MNRIISAVVMVAIVAGSHLTLAPAAKAADVDGGWIGGAPIGREFAPPAAYPAPPPPVHYAPAPAYPSAPVYPPAPVFAPARVFAPAAVDVDEEQCRLVRQQYFDGYGYRIRRVQVCD